jgi:hypothetical protein
VPAIGLAVFAGADVFGAPVPVAVFAMLGAGLSAAGASSARHALVIAKNEKIAL